MIGAKQVFFAVRRPGATDKFCFGIRCKIWREYCYKYINENYGKTDSRTQR